VIKSVSALKNVWKIPDLRRKVIYTLALLAVYRLGAHVPAPFIDPKSLQEFIERQRAAGGGLFAVVDLFSGYAFRNMSVFALGIMPYISMSIILQLMTVVMPRLQKLQQEGALGQRKINKWTRIGTIALAGFQGFGLGIHLLQQGLSIYGRQHPGIFLFTTMMAMTTGTAFLMWLGERITEKGIGNGISLLIAFGILAHYPQDGMMIANQIKEQTLAAIWAPVIAILFVISTVAIILIQEGTRRIPIQHAKRVVGRRVMSGGTNYLPLKVNTAGVIPVIFASAILSFPSFIATYISPNREGGGFIGQFFSRDSGYNLYSMLQRWGLQYEGIFLVLKSFNMYIILFGVLTAFFCFFYTAIAFNPDDVANNLKKAGSFIPGKRPGKPTSEYIDFVLTRVTAVGSLFLVLIAVAPMVLETSYRMPYSAGSFVGGTGLIIVIGVMLDTLRQIESQLLMRHYDGFALRRSSASRWR
jgi:preprotein translocase subunit SecY